MVALTAVERETDGFSFNLRPFARACHAVALMDKSHSTADSRATQTGNGFL